MIAGIVAGGRPVPPTAPAVTDPYWSSVSLLMHFDGDDGSTVFTDSSPTPKTSTPFGDFKLSTSWKQYGTASGRALAAGDYLRITSGGDELSFGSGDFTIEITFRLASIQGGVANYIYDSRWGSSPNSPQISVTEIGTISFLRSGVELITGTTTVSAGTTYVVSVSRVGTALRMFVNGVQEGGTQSNATVWAVGSASNPLTIGANTFNSSYGPLLGSVDELRVTKGVGRYTADYQPADAAFPDQ